ncbi:hypothetical protein [Hasllibacter sp. MH4015]|uniref:hypothetical protein n=1 Tax=Hasllibacter sp. MH4015 TaxID=2854029 RepID=UPI001CD1BC95|nr:hypothetical protein [Hasllibacter sp. MH4015]
MKTGLPLLVIGLVFGGGIGFTIAAANGIALEGHDHSDPAHHAGGHVSHGMSLPEGINPEDVCTSVLPDGDVSGHDHDTLLVLDDAADAPTLAVELVADPGGGWNLRITTDNFTFSPENVSLGHVPGEGHAHVYVNGVKLGRFYGPWVHLGDLASGDVVEVTLNANDHRTLAVGDAALSASVTIPD